MESKFLKKIKYLTSWSWFKKGIKTLVSINRMEDANDAIAMIFEGGQFWLLGWCIVFIFAVAIMNYAGKSKVKNKM